MEDDETLDDMVNKITPDNFHEEIDDDLREWLDLPNEFDEKEWTWDGKDEDENKKKTKELIEKVENNNYEFTHSAEEIRNLNQGETRYEFTYKNYFGTMHYSEADEVYYGKVLYTNDLITYEAETKEDLKKAFQEMVDLHIKDLKEEE